KPIVLRIVSVATLAAIGTGLVIGNKIALDQESNLNSLLCPPLVQEDALERSRESGQEMAKQIIEEGSVLLKNNGVLPLEKSTSDCVNVFGWASIDWAYGANSSSCSGRVMAENSKREDLVDIYDALTAYGIEYNEGLKNMYNRYAAPYLYATKNPDQVNNGNVITLHEPEVNDPTWYTDEILDDAEAYSDTALVVITRNAGEDIPADRAMTKAGSNYEKEQGKIYLDVSIEEIHLLEYVGQAFDNVVVLVNSPAAMDLSFLRTIPGIDAALQVGFTGTHGAAAIPGLLYGDLSPSGRLVDTYVYDRNSSFAYKAKNAANFSSGLGGKHFYEYIENIYVGYKWYETADAEGYWDDYTRTLLDESDKEYQAKGYEAVVEFPFGYGLSYADFDYDLREVTFTKNGNEIPSLDIDGEIHFKVKVQNTSTFPAKEVVEVYLEAPYTAGEIEKSSKNLVGFEKTIELEGGKSQIVDVAVTVRDLASYDCYDRNNDGHTGYEIEGGQYKFHFGKNAHEDVRMSFYPSTEVREGVYSLEVPSTLYIDYAKNTNTRIQNHFTGEDAVDGYPLDAVEEGGYAPKYLSREAFPDINEFTGTKSRPASQQLIDAYFFTKEKGDAWDNAEVDAFGDPTYAGDVVWGEDHGLRIYENGEVTDLGFQLGADYDDPDWDELLEQVTVSEALNTINKSYGTPAINSIGKPVCHEVDGPAQIKCYYQNPPRGTGYPDAVVLAQTWNVELIEDFGLSFAQDMVSVSIHGLWGWGTNLHRTPVGGRNWEYFSEDSFISGKTLTAATKGLLKGGRYSYIKHLCLNESESGKVEGFTFVTEQAYRETYLKPFQMAIEDGGAVGVMTSFNRIGAVYSGGSEATITGVLRREWGFHGAIITDWANNGGYMSIDHQLRAGGDLGMNNNLNGYEGARFTYSDASTPRLQQRMKDVVHHVAYSFLRSQYLNKLHNENPDSDVKVIQGAVIESFQWWKMLLIDVDILLGGGALLFVVMTFLPGKKKEQ
ncbi:MAG: glycoside hydrolase family 3 C-terminal domain-containing protein, partial [Bacilli bacterium]|nr:glycoside hydrolase family 3 C-terminal domain-containing protein [Bacilli bacterium]